MVDGSFSSLDSRPELGTAMPSGVVHRIRFDPLVYSCLCANFGADKGSAKTNSRREPLDVHNVDVVARICTRWPFPFKLPAIELNSYSDVKST
jgi:hypothetical protein